MPNTEKNTSSSSSVSVIATGCSRIKSIFSLCRPLPLKPIEEISRQQQQKQEKEEDTLNKTPLLTSNNKKSSSAYKAYSDKVKQLEMELHKLKKRLSTDKKLAMNEQSTAIREARGPIDGELIRLADGSYLREVKKIGSPWGRLAMQVSSPTIVENGSNATQVLTAMTSIEIEELYNCLVESMPMGDITGCDISKIQKRTVMKGSEDDFMEGTVVNTIEKIEALVMEGLRIQMRSTRKERADRRKKEKEITKECVVIVMMIHVRDPDESYEIIGELMIALVEVERKNQIEGVHVAGIKCAATRDGEEEYYMWNASVEGNNCIRNPDVDFTVYT